jgi:transposase
MDTQDASKDGAARSPRLSTPDRSQVDPNPRIVDELIPQGHEARTVWELTGTLDIERLLGQIKAVEGHPGRRHIDPRVLVALWLYATIDGVSSA